MSPLLRSALRREGTLAFGEAAAAGVVVSLFAPSAERLAAFAAVFVLGMIASGWLAGLRLGDPSRDRAFLVGPLIARALGWAVAAIALSDSPAVPLSAAYFGLLVGAARAVVYRVLIDRRLEDAPASVREPYLRATLFERLVLSVDALGMLAGNALVLSVIAFMDVNRGQVRAAWIAAPLFSGTLLCLRWIATHVLVRRVLEPERPERARGRARALPAILAALHSATWIIATLVSLVGWGRRIQLQQDDQIIVMALAALLVWGALLYQMRWHRSTLGRLEPFMPGPALPPRTQTLRARMLLVFGFPVLFACALSLFASLMQYRLLATRLVASEAADRADPLAERLGAAAARGELRQAVLRLDPPVGMVVIVVTTDGEILRAGSPAPELLAIGGGPVRAPQLSPPTVRALRRGERGRIQVERPLMTGAYRPLPGDGPRPGGVAVLLPGYRGAGRVGHIVGLLLYSLALALVAGGVVAWASQELAIPVRRLGQTADSIASGRLAATVEPVEVPAELAQLSTSLERMRRVLVEKIEEIAQLNVGLEAKVAERTNELRLANRELGEALERLKSAQAQLVHSEKMASLGQLVAGVAHEINNPLNIILNTLGPLEQELRALEGVLDAYGALEREPADPRAREAVAAARASADLDAMRPELRRMVSVMRTGAERAVKIVAGLRTFSRAQAGEAAPFDVNEGLEESLALIGHLVRAGGVEIVRELGELPKIQCKGGEVNQVFLNLLTNAVQSGARRIVLSTRRIAEAVEIEIADDGTGIGEQELSRIFDPFYTTKPVGSGTGLGLSISLGIVRAHGGTIAADSRVGQGTTFRVRLPV